MVEIPNDQNLAPLLADTQSLFKSMEREFEDAAAYYGFSCAGCEDNCCMSLFYHHTLAEYFFIEKGLSTLSENARSEAVARARDYVTAMAGASGGNMPPRLMCPLNVDWKCMLYPFRPMICRLFGLPHEFNRPGGGRISGPGCARFYDVCGEKAYRGFDRTPYYQRLSGLEQSFRETTGTRGKIKMTVAEILVRLDTGEEK